MLNLNLIIEQKKVKSENSYNSFICICFTLMQVFQKSILYLYNTKWVRLQKILFVSCKTSHYLSPFLPLFLKKFIKTSYLFIGTLSILSISKYQCFSQIFLKRSNALPIFLLPKIYPAYFSIAKNMHLIHFYICMYNTCTTQFITKIKQPYIAFIFNLEYHFVLFKLPFLLLC